MCRCKDSKSNTWWWFRLHPPPPPPTPPPPPPPPHPPTLYCRTKWFGSLVRPAIMSTQPVTSHRKLSGSFKRPRAVYSVSLFVDLRGSSTSLDTIWSTGVPGYAAPVSTDSLRCLLIEDTSHRQWSPACWVSTERECLAREASGSDSPWQLVSACAAAHCSGPSCRDHTSTCRSPTARPPATVPMHQAIHISDLGLTDWIDVKSDLRQICCPKICLDFLWSLMDFSGKCFHIVNNSHYCVGWKQAKSTGIHGCAHPGF